ncbi:MAG: DNA polymerase III subunit gamma/tau [Chitinophagaceae bacterium]
MENFVVSARKYRPQDFGSVVGQAHITTTLKNAILHHQLAHAFLFCGPRGVGKTTCARILAKTINCENQQPDGEACNICPSCKSFNEGSSFNIHEMDAASNNSVDDIRTLTEQVRFVPQAGKYKVYIIDEVHMLSQGAFNAFLKTLEEPPPYAIFILATTEKHKILPTILSRCQIFDFKRITIQDTVEHLKEICRKENTQTDLDALHLIAQKSDGCMRDALSILDKIVSFTNGVLNYPNTLEHLNILDYDYYFRVMDALKVEDAGLALLIFDEILQKGFEGDDFIQGLSDFMRNLLVCKDDRVLHLMEGSDHMKERYQQCAREAPASFLVSALQILNDGEIYFKQAKNKRLHVEMVLIRLCYLQQAIQLIGQEMTGEVTKKKLTEPSRPAQKLRNAFPQPLQLKRGPSTEEPQNLTLPPGVQEGVVPSISPVQPLQEPNPAVGPILPIAAEARKSGTTYLPGNFGTTFSILKGARKKMEAGLQEDRSSGTIDLTPENLTEKWGRYILELRQDNKSTIAVNLEQALWEIKSAHELEILSKNIVQHKFIEEEKPALAIFLKKEFQNPYLIITLKMDPSSREAAPDKVILTSRDQFLRMVEKYPQIKDLKEKLHLEMEY